MRSNTALTVAISARQHARPFTPACCIIPPYASAQAALRSKNATLLCGLQRDIACACQVQFWAMTVSGVF